ncbi:MAG: thioredoxin domain-containing protein [Candidatus Thermoplasmatota archaeon]|nr:thioredoxin domain-containing protein [Candidatus Thermoplasmatota archaeon]
MRRIEIGKNDDAAEWMPGAIFVVSLLLASFLVVSINTNGVTAGIGKGEMAPDFTGLAHLPGNDTADWFSYRLYEHLDMNWSGNYTEGVFTIIEFLDTDCPHCWNSAGKLSSLNSQLIDYGVADRVQFIIIAVQLPIDGHTSSIEEIVAFQEKLPHSGCFGDSKDCSTRPGDPHPGVYIDDLSNEIFQKYSPKGTPHYMILKPNGIVGWDGQQDNLDEIGIELTNLICKDGGDNQLCSQVSGV